MTRGTTGLRKPVRCVDAASPRTTAIAFAAALLPQTALALSCLPPDLARDYLDLAARDTSYSILVGQVIHNVDYRVDEQDYAFTARFIGYGYAPDASQIPVDQRLRVEGSCINGDCGYLSDSNTSQIVFARHDTGGMVIEVFPCAATPTPATPQNITTIEACLTGGPCEAADPW